MADASNARALTAEQRAKIEQSLLAKVAARRGVSKSPRAVPETLPLTPAQMNLVVLDQLQPRSAVYNIPLAFRVIGRLEAPILRKSLEHVVGRHDVLRRVVAKAPSGFTHVLSTKPFQFEHRELNGSAPGAETVSALLLEEARRGFSLAEDMPVRAVLLSGSAIEHWLAITFHHIATDHASVAQFLDELGRAYHAFSTASDPRLEPVQFSFSDYVLHRQAKDSSQDADLEFWKKKLTPPPQAIDLPLSKPRPSKRGFTGDYARRIFPPELFRQINEAARTKRTTSNVITMAGFQVLLHRYSGAVDFLVGCPVTGRNQPGSEQAIGFFVNTCALRADLSGSPTFDVLVQKTRDQFIELLDHSDTPLELILEKLHFAREEATVPALQVVFQYLNGAPLALQLAGTTVSRIHTETATSKFDLILTIEETAAGVECALEFDSELFARGQMEALLEHYERLLSALLKASETPVDEIDFLNAAEQTNLLRSWNNTAREYPQLPVHALFDQQAALTPGKTALRMGSSQMTYLELRAAANRAAQSLAHSGVKPGDKVAVLLPRSFDLIVSLLAILKAGAAYVPVDKALPETRLSFILQTANVGVVVTSKDKSARLPKTVQFLLVEDLPKDDSSTSDSSRGSDTGGSLDATAYVMFTSGSTGDSKGVAIPHRGIVRLVKEADYAEFDSSQVFLQFAPVSFDAATLEIWGPLLNGGELVIFPPEFESLDQLGQVIEQERITTLWLTAGLFHQLVDHNIQCLKGVRQLLAGGDVLSPAHVQRVIRELPSTQLINGYGPTENTTFTCCYRFPRDWNGQGSVPIGKPISNTRVYILDAKKMPVPIGVKGELYIAGDGLALNYINDSDLNAQKFVELPLDPNGRAYRSGDLVKWRDDGNIDFIGRIDSQVKVRGFRIEIGEVETVIARHPDVRSAVVQLMDDTTDKFLAAWIVPERAGLDSATLRAWLQTTLAPHAIPSRFEFVEAFPLTPNGKVDKRKLTLSGSAESTQDEAPQTPTEQIIHAVWTEVLGPRRYGRFENFFTAGGHSLAGMRIVSRLNEQTGAELTMGSMFEAPTIAGLAQVIDQRATADTPSQLSADLASISDAELDAMLTEILEKKGP